MKRNKILLLALSTMMLIGCANNGASSSSNSSTSEGTTNPSTSESIESPSTSEESSSESTLAPESSDSSTSESTSTPETSIPESSTPESSEPESSIPESSIPESSTPETSEPSNPEVPTEDKIIISIDAPGNEGQKANGAVFRNTGAFEAQTIDTIYNGGKQEPTAVKFGSAKNHGTLEFTSSNSYTIKTVIINAKTYSKDTDCKIKVSLSNQENKTLDITSKSYQDYVFSFNGNEKVNGFTLSSLTKEKRVYVRSITITATEFSGGEVNPNPDVDPSLPNTSIPDSSDSSNGGSSHKPITPNTDISNPDNDPYRGTYYSGISSSLEGDSLVRALEKLISSTHSPKSYDALYQGYKLTDVKPGTKNQVWDMYSNCTFYYGSSKEGGNYKNEGDIFNREHTVPQSWFNKRSPMRNDIYHVVPTDGKVNGMRSNYPHGEVVSNVTYTSSNGSKVGLDANGTKVFEPIDEYKGDFARMYFYMLTRYRGQVGSWEGGVFSSSYPYMRTKYFDLYVKWALEDPVSEKEITRNEGGQKHQGNRNPYVDHPSYFYKAFVK